MVHEACTFTLSPTVGPKMSVYSALGMVAVLVEVTTSSYTKANRLKIQTKKWKYHSTSWSPNPKGLPATCGQILDQQFFASPSPSFQAKQDRRLSHFLLSQLYKQHMSFSDCLLKQSRADNMQSGVLVKTNERFSFKRNCGVVSMWKGAKIGYQLIRIKFPL